MRESTSRNLRRLLFARHKSVLVLLSLLCFASLLGALPWFRRSRAGVESSRDNKSNAVKVTNIDHRYNDYHANRGSQACEACRHLEVISSMFPCAETIYDAGAGNCRYTRKLMKRGYDVRGTEFAALPLEKFCKDLVDDGVVFQSSLTDIPFKEDFFDLVTSFEVLEHVPINDVDRAIAELVRVSKGQIFATISLRRSVLDLPFPKDPKIHVTVKQRSWWDAKFREHGCVVNEFLYDLLQKKIKASMTEKTLGKLTTKYIKSFGESSEQSFWEGGDVEPWYFIYTCKGAKFSLPTCDDTCEKLIHEASTDIRITNATIPLDNSICAQREFS